MRNSLVITRQKGTILAVIPFCLLIAALVSTHLWSLIFQTLSIIKTDREAETLRLKNMSALMSDLSSRTESGCFQSHNYHYCLQKGESPEHSVLTSPKTPIRIDWSVLLEKSLRCTGACESKIEGGQHAFIGSLQSPNVECFKQPCSIAATESVLIDRLAITAPTLIVAARDIRIKLIAAETSQPVALTLVSTQGRIEIFEILGPLALNLHGQSPHENLSQRPHNGVMVPQIHGVLSIWPLTLN